MIGRMTPELIDLWMAFDALEPLGNRGNWLQNARMTQLKLAEMGVESEVDDFIPGYQVDE